ncbi:MAG: endolytic transglycosylase MltG [Candidatus Moranbacteria bacterium]|jgi:UPF0755 protein|nr:endolytic transglycosylase MltG [Candidatus Moranbacteria bacterium]MDD5652487.1 endolytic transglycosylase MltG [Candidatus Moranbacteria bacterium]MDX9855947.1 endolytic transglycosylase MltG [Candidatus Moranbacteria bacterium]
MNKIIKIGLMALFFLALISSLSLFVNKGGREIVVADFKIEKGENAWEVGRNLKREGLVKWNWKFIFHIYKEGLQKEIKAGRYKLNSGLSVEEIAGIITEGKIAEEDRTVRITFPEGWSVGQMAVRLEENGFSGDRFIDLSKDPDYFEQKYNFEFLANIPKGKNLEGFLFPDTYFLNPGLENEESVIKKMLENFSIKFSEDLDNEIKKQGKTAYEIVTMASILEKEVRTEEDRKIVSGIFWNRLESGQAFQSCATLAFILGENKKQYSYEDTQVDSPYNTYLHPGLPPGPISNPGLDAIKAAVYPIDTDYNYFLNNPETGETVFSRAIEEHNANKVKNGL